MKLFTREQLQLWDKATIEHHYTASSELMQVAARLCTEMLLEKVQGSMYVFFCGTGNNGGDGLAMAHILHNQQIAVHVIVVGDPARGSADFRENLQQAIDGDLPLNFMNASPSELNLDKDAVIVDAIFGLGLNRKVEGWIAQLIMTINELPNCVVSIDVPSGLMADALVEQSGAIIAADITLTFELPKRSMLFPENDKFVGRMSIVHLALDESFHDETLCTWTYLDDAEVRPLLRERNKFAHKGSYGHLHVIAGSRGMMGACTLACYAAMRTGAGKVTASVTEGGLHVLQTAVPEVLCSVVNGDHELAHFIQVEGATALVLGPGCGPGKGPTALVDQVLSQGPTQLLLDADALNIIAREGWQSRIPKGAILTPHVGEFDRLFGKHNNHFERLESQLRASSELSIFIVLKGANTRITTPLGAVYINATGNPGMATAGSGDVLSGIIGGLLVQGYGAHDSTLLGVFLHGLAGDVAADTRGMESLIARDIIEYIGDAYAFIRGTQSQED